ncbi:Gldg family protein [Desulfoluna sp.]|uniref:GldG family protein n=1 Tax=Desulfoluna sp. TaxID=2045199 RepID=UPI0026139954|nr:Gldg family protein [Desulfoluna sp.]
MKKEKYLKGLIYIVVVVLLNIAGATLFFRADLTKNKVYSLSKASIEAVKNLSEPLTINVFFSDDLPAPHNNTQKYLADLLDEYAVHATRYFNFRFYPIGGDIETNPTSKRNAELAKSYGIRPVSIQIVESDEVKVKTAYMGLVVIHGDLIERLPAITSTEGLEYKLTTSMMKLGNKISTLLALKEEIEADLYLSQSMAAVAPLMGLDDLSTLPGRVKAAVTKVSRRSYDQLSFNQFNPASLEEKQALSDRYNMLQLRWPDLSGGKVKADSGIIGMVMRYAEKTVVIPILEVNRIPLFGTQYKLMTDQEMEEAISGAVESLIDINEKIGYLTSHGTPQQIDRNAANPMAPPTEALNNFSANLARSYAVSEVDLKENGIPAAINSLVIAGAKETFSDYELFEIDQALMAGKNIAVFVDAFKEMKNPNPQMAFMQPTTFTPVKTGLEKLLAHYGVTVQNAYIMDENCYKQNLPRRLGGGQQNVYFAPIIKNNTINHDVPFMNNIKGLVTLKAAPVSIDKKTLATQNLTGTTLFSTSNRSWLQETNIALNPMFLNPPTEASAFSSRPVAAMVEGTFTSYFKGKPIPEKPAVEGKETPDTAENKATAISQSGAMMEQGKPARLVVVGSLDMLTNSLFDEQGGSANATFIMNLMDGLNGREEIAVMRSKKQRFNPLDKVPDTLKTPVKAFNIVGLPLLVALFGMAVYLKRQSRRKTIRAMFQ